MIEIELKCAISATHFQTLLTYFSVHNQPPIRQTNYYYDTKSSHLKKLSAALRLRQSNQHSEWTIKQAKTIEKSLEINVPTDSNIEIPFYITPTLFNNTEIAIFLEQASLQNEIFHQIAYFTTHRWTIKTLYGEFALDHTIFANHEDYEIELETTNLEESRQYFQHLLQQLDIPFIPSEKKIKRALQSFTENQHSNH